MIGKDLARAIALLQAEEVVAIPTETVYGLAGNAFSPKAVSTIFAVKNRPSFDPLIVHTNEFGRAAAFTAEIPELAYELAARFMPGPLTILLPKAAVIPDIVTAGLPAVAVRVPRHPLAQELLRRLDFPLAAPSANPFGYISPTAAEHVEQQLGGLIPYILDGGPCQVGLESTIIGFENGQARRLSAGRAGGGGIGKSHRPASAAPSFDLKPRRAGHVEEPLCPPRAAGLGLVGSAAGAL
jgi:L-threonylcarbamoyladenylate synthase